MYRYSTRLASKLGVVLPHWCGGVDTAMQYILPYSILYVKPYSGI